MLDFFAGLVIFLSLFIAKKRLVELILFKKQVALSVAIIVLSESLMLFMLYISIDKYRLDGIKLLAGFLASLSIMLVFYCIKFLKKDTGS
jgi:uncharacterized membrane protein YqjE